MAPRDRTDLDCSITAGSDSSDSKFRRPQFTCLSTNCSRRIDNEEASRQAMRRIIGRSCTKEIARLCRNGRITNAKKIHQALMSDNVYSVNKICRRSLEMSCSRPLEMSGSKDGLDHDERTRSRTDRTPPVASVATVLEITPDCSSNYCQN